GQSAECVALHTRHASVRMRSRPPLRSSRFRHCAGVAQSAETISLTPIQCGFDALHQHQYPADAPASLPSPRAILRSVMSSPGAIAFQIGPLVIRWYGILMATAIVVGLWLGHRQAKREGLPADDIISCGQWAILAGLVGARLSEVAFNW